MTERRRPISMIIAAGVNAGRRLGSAFIGTSYSVTITTPHGTFIHYIAGSNIANSFQHAYGAAVQAYHYAAQGSSAPVVQALVDGAETVTHTLFLAQRRCQSGETLMRAPARASACERDAGLSQLSPGMSAQVEVITGRRSVMAYLISPIARATSEAGRER
jgi:hypothetical protein